MSKSNKKKKTIEVGTIGFEIRLTRDEAYAVIKKPTKKIAKDLRVYVLDVLKEGCKHFLQTKIGEE